MTKPRWYWHHFTRTALPVTVHLTDRDRTFGWRWIVGVQCGGWFIGAINGSDHLASSVSDTGETP